MPIKIRTRSNRGNASLLPAVLALLSIFSNGPAAAQESSNVKAKGRGKSALSNALNSAPLSTQAAWPPPDVDKSVPAVLPDAQCSLSDVLGKAGSRIQELTRNMDRFTATEIVRHQRVDRAGRLRPPEIRTFDYIVSMASKPSGLINVEEYRKSRGSLDQFPDGIATLGTPSLVLIFHPHYVKSFRMICEGLGQWQGRPAWQVRFEESHNNNPMSTLEIGGRAFGMRLRGRAWILADSYQVVRLETDLADQIPQIRLRLQHQDVEYRPVPLPQSKRELWLPSRTELYMDFLGRRFYRQHNFTNVQFFSVKVQQTIAPPKDLAEQ